tara:strand:+ start:711 stop:1094 length:384 start_codon:yes stop_codon:yes gene_type:complete
MTSNIIKNIVVTTFLFLIIDSIYLKFLKTMADKLVFNIQGSKLKLNYTGAFFSYLCIIILFNYFVIYKKGSLLDSFLLGFLTYGIFEGTSKALFSKWTYDFMLIDTVWGGILFSLVYLSYNKIKNFV